MSSQRKIYLSYNRSDGAYADQIRFMLRTQLQVDVIDPVTAPLGQDWQLWIDQQIETASALVFLVGDRTHNSSFVDYEARRAGRLGKPIVLVKLDPSDVVPDALYAVQSVWTNVTEVASALEAVLAS